MKYTINVRRTTHWLLLAAVFSTLVGMQIHGSAKVDTIAHAIQQDTTTKPYAELKSQDSPAANTGALRAQIAITEYNKGVREATPNCNCGKDVFRYTGGVATQWCAAFATWVANEAGTPVANPSTGSWRFINSQKLLAELKSQGKFYTKDDIKSGSTTPQVGDLVFFWRGSTAEELGHVDIIVAVHNNGTADLVGGNVNNAVSYRKSFPYMNSYGFQGIARP
ncbi:MAG: CHAP domain-containing protein [Candidatus Saccharimonas sp.]